jgi:hypothetical protein
MNQLRFCRQVLASSFSVLVIMHDMTWRSNDTFIELPYIQYTPPLQATENSESRTMMPIHHSSTQMTMPLECIHEDTLEITYNSTAVISIKLQAEAVAFLELFMKLVKR